MIKSHGIVLNMSTYSAIFLQRRIKQITVDVNPF